MARNATTESETRPLFNIDPGWLFIVAGLALCISGVLIPAQRDLHELHSQLELLQERERLGNERLRAHAEFIADLDRDDHRLDITKRLAASQLNLVPAGDVPVIVTASHHAALTEWIDARTGARHRASAGDRSPGSLPFPDSTLTRLATGPKRLWLLGGGVLAVFMGLMLAPNSDKESRRARWAKSTTSTPNHAHGSGEVDRDDASTSRKESSMLLNFESWETTESFDSVELPAADREEHDCEVVVTAGYFTAGAAEDHRCAAD